MTKIEGMSVSVFEHVMRLDVLIDEEVAKISPDNALLVVLQDAQRVAREYCELDWRMKGLEK